MSEHIELEPCPYCGGHAGLSKVGRDWYRIAADHVTSCPLEDFQLDCPQSDDQLPLLLHDWNTRVDRSPSNNAEKCDQLRAEIAGLRTGYEAYERVNAEVEALRHGLGLARHWCASALKAAPVDSQPSEQLLDIACLLRHQASDIDAAMGQGEKS